MIAEQFLRETRVAPGELARVLGALLQDSLTDAWQVAGRANVPFAELVEILQQLQAHHLLEYSTGSAVAAPLLRLTADGHGLARALNIHPTHDPTCRTCGGSGVELDQFAGARDEFAPLLAGRPPAISNYDQGALTAESVFRRVAQMYVQGNIAGKRLLLLGDDDLVSLALALTQLPREIVVVEIDARLCAFIAEIAQARHLPITVLQHDLRQRLPAAFHGAFDTFITDPVETIQGLLLFVEKGLSTLALGAGGAGYFGITLIEASLHKWNLWERHLLQNHAIVLTQISAPYSLYDKGAEEVSLPQVDFAPFAHPPLAPWYRSSFFRIETLAEFVPPPDYETNPRDELYQDAESLDEAWMQLARGEARSPLVLPDEFLRESSERAAAATRGLGQHVIAEFWNCANESPLNGLDNAIEAAVQGARATLLDLQIRKFYPQGFSAIALLAESHLSLHAWPELGYVALDVFTCGQADPQQIMRALENHFRPHQTAFLKIPRGRARDALPTDVRAASKG